MIRVSDLMQTDVATISPRATVAELVEFFDRLGITGAPVVDDQERLVGVVSVRDVVQLAREMGEAPEAMRWGLARAEVSTESPFMDSPLEGEFFAYYVTPSGGFVDVSSQIQEFPQKVFEGYDVETIMTPAPVTLSPDASVQKLARTLRDRKIHRVLVVRDHQLVGIVTTTDILDYVAED
jgi:CBS domain-containing protein